MSNGAGMIIVASGRDWESYVVIRGVASSRGTASFDVTSASLGADISVVDDVLAE